MKDNINGFMLLNDQWNWSNLVRTQEIFEVLVVEDVGEKTHALIKIDFGAVSFAGSDATALLSSVNYHRASIAD